MPARASILIVDDEEGTHVSITRSLDPSLCRTLGVANAEEALVALAREAFDLVLCDIHLGGMNGLDLQKRIHAEYPGIPVVMITAYAAVDTAVRALKQGAYDYLPKPFSGEEIRSTVHRALETQRLRLENTSLREAVREAQGGIWRGESVAMKRLYERAAQVAATAATVFISGESGTGKEILARFVHENSPRHDRVFLAVNCAGLQETLADSQLFGHVRGAFTGAVSDQRGFLELAHGGTLFLDEMADLREEIQAKLLRVLEDHRFRRLGSEREGVVDVRFLVAAAGDPDALVKTGRLREDLYFRLGGIQLRVPPLRERVRDIRGLALHFLARFSREIKKPIAGLEPEVADLLERYPWPGNVRELKNVMERAAIFVPSGQRVGPAELPEKIRQAAGPALFSVHALPPLPLEEVNDRYIRHILEFCGGNQAKAVRILGISSSTLWRHLPSQDHTSPQEPSK
ncbi:MAG: sigma-54-dependent Fis family transcriptional regulator [Planctomycetes bacterium]|nr:sigma-54-dependent Fis family transcriptional regulator [Planctomycetota bacterium]